MHSFLLDTIRRGSQRLDAPRTRESLMVGRSPLEEPAGAEAPWLTTRTPDAAQQLETLDVDSGDPPAARQRDTKTERASHIPTERNDPPPPAPAPVAYGDESDPSTKAGPYEIKANAEPELQVFDPPQPERPTVTHESITPMARLETSAAAVQPVSESPNPGAPLDVPRQAEAAFRRVYEEPKINVALPKMPTPIQDPVIRIPSTLYERERSSYQKLRPSRFSDSPGPFQPASLPAAAEVDLGKPAVSAPRLEPTEVPRALSLENQDGTVSQQAVPQAPLAVPQANVLDRGKDPTVAAIDPIPTNLTEQPARPPRAVIEAPRAPLDLTLGKRTEGVPHAPPVPQTPAENVPKLKINSLEVRIVNEPPRDTGNRRRPVPSHSSGEAVSSLERNHLRSVGLLY